MVNQLSDEGSCPEPQGLSLCIRRRMFIPLAQLAPSLEGSASAGSDHRDPRDLLQRPAFLASRSLTLPPP
jgi:hypothetical protein